MENISTAHYVCEDDGYEVDIKFTVGEIPEPPICECGKDMVRVFRNVGVGNITDGNMVDIKQMMSYHSKNNR